jgi:hypothetical protein
LFEDLFLTVGRVSHLDQVLALLPEFFVPAANTLHFIMRENGPLTLPWRNYLAILASSRFRCDSLMSLQRREFLVNGGDEQWLAGVAHAPQKIQSLLELNARLAHQPWTINREHITKLLKGTEAWSVAELVHAIVLLSTFHYLACVSHGVGVTTEQDLVWTPHASFFSGTACGYAANAMPATSADAVASGAADGASPSEEGSSSAAPPAAPSSVDAAETSGAAASSAGTKSSRKSFSEYGSPSMSGSKQNTQQLARLLATDLETLVADASQSVDPASVPIRIIPVAVAAPGPEAAQGAKDASSYLSPVAEFIPGRSATAPDGSNPSIVPLPRSSSSGNNLASLAAGSGASRISPVSSVLGLSSLVSPAASAAAAPAAAATTVPASSVSAAALAECPTAVSAEAALVFLAPSPLAAMQYETYDIKAFTALHEEEYSWKEHGFALVNRFYKGVAPLLDAELDLIYDYTENNLGSGQDQLDNVDTGPFRRAIWYYAHRVFGMTAGDVDYKMVNIFLSRPLKAFVKRVTCFPDSIGAAEFEEALGTYSFRPSEKLHIVLLAAEGRRQACLLHALNAVMEHMAC